MASRKRLAEEDVRLLLEESDDESSWYASESDIEESDSEYTDSDSEVEQSQMMLV